VPRPKKLRWLSSPFAVFVNEQVVAQSGGSPGLRDRGLLESALARGQQRATYDESADLCDLAASLGYGLVKNHAFVDGNKRTAFQCVYVFLADNGLQLVAEELDVVLTVEGLAAGRVSEPAFADWLRSNCRKGRRR
jgi:death-on-curing protein